MKQFVVKFDTVIQGRPAIAGDYVSLTDADAKGYKAAGLIAGVGPDAIEDHPEPEPINKPAPKKAVKPTK